MLVKFSLISIFLSVFLSSFNFASGSYKSFYYKRFLEGNIKISKSSKVVPKIFNQKINHFDENDKRTFNQRYFINQEFARSKDAPVFLYICGESTCKEGRLERGAIVEYAKKFNAILIALEHRYYGKSMPFSTLETKNLKYLSTDQAIRDLAYFQTQITKKFGLQKKWITFGGSYPGSLSAYYRLKFPNLVLGALASSAPVKADENFDEYDAHVYKVVGQRCSHKMLEAVQEIEASMSNPEEFKNYKKLFGATDVKHPIDFLYIIADIGAIAAQYGYVRTFCNDLIKADTAVKGYIKFSKYIMNAWNMKPSELAVEWAKNTDPKTYLHSFGMRQWYYQSCTEYGYWQNAHPSKSVRSSLINLEYHNEICNRLFGLKKGVDTSLINNKYYYPLFNATEVRNIYFTNGSTDPWLNLSIGPELAQSRNSNLLSFMIEGSAHCDDLGGPRSSDSKPLEFSRLLMEQSITKWLK